MRTHSSYMSQEQMSSDVHEYAKYSNVYGNFTLGFIVLGKRLSSIFGAVYRIYFLPENFVEHRLSFQRYWPIFHSVLQSRGGYTDKNAL